MGIDTFGTRVLRKALPLFIGLASACGQVETTEPSATSASDDVILGETSQPLVVANVQWWMTELRTCWTTATSDPEELRFREIVRDAVVGSWQAASPMRFVGWGVCASSTPAAGEHIRIQSDGSWPRSWLGTESMTLNGPSMFLTRTFADPGVREAFSNCRLSQADTDRCVRAIAIHEFGHALGFDHEQTRTDTPTWCTGEQALRPGTPLGAWDLSSVMNYCNPTWINNGRLSDGDVQGLLQTYGYLGPATRIAAGGLWLNAGQSVNSGDRVIAFTTDGNLVVQTPLGRPLWTSNTGGKICTASTCRAVFQGDGNLVLSQNGAPYWASNTTVSNGELVVSGTAPQLSVRSSQGQVLWASDFQSLVATPSPVVISGFGTMFEASVVVTNYGPATGTLSTSLVRTQGGTNLLSVNADDCSGRSLAPGASCRIDLDFFCTKRRVASRWNLTVSAPGINSLAAPIIASCE